MQKLLLESFKYGTRPTRTTRSTTKRGGADKKKTPPKRKSDGGEKKESKRPKVNKPKLLSPGLAGT